MPRIGEALRFGQDFRLRTVEYQTSLPLYLECPIPNICSAVGPSGHPFIRLTSKPNRYCRLPSQIRENKFNVYFFIKRLINFFFINQTYFFFFKLLASVILSLVDQLEFDS